MSITAAIFFNNHEKHFSVPLRAIHPTAFSIVKKNMIYSEIISKNSYLKDFFLIKTNLVVTSGKHLKDLCLHCALKTAH